MKKICFVLDQFLFGGIEKVLINYVKAINKKEYSIDIIILSQYEDMINNIPKDCNVIIKKLPRNDCPLSRASTMVRRNGGAILYYGSYFLKKVFLEPINFIKFHKERKKEYDVVIAFSGHINDIYATIKFLKGRKKIVWAHGMIYQYLLISPAFEKMYKKFDKIVCINELNQNDIFDCKPYLKYKIECLYNPIPFIDNTYNSKDLEKIEKKYGNYILSVARMAEPKDYKTLIDAYAIFKEKMKEPINLVIIGDGPDRKKIETYIKEKNLEDTIFLLGSLNNIEMFYKMAKIFVLSSKSEGLPTVIVEAMSFGKPVISTDAPYGPRDIIKNNQYGILISVGDSKEMAQKMYDILSNEELYNKYSIKSLERFKDFSPEKIMKKFYEIIED